MKKNAAAILLIFSILFALGVLVYGQKTQRVGGAQVMLDDLRASMVDEFNEAYPEAAPASGSVREFDLTASESEILLPSGVSEKLFTYNGQSPGPVLRVKLGETLKINFKNQLPQDTTVHFHGVRVPNAMDGVPGVNQEPVEPGGSFTYEFTPKDAGTFWFHPHVRTSEQMEKGLYGVLIVEEENPPAYTRDIVWVLDDWRLNEDGTLNMNFNTGHDLMHDGRWGNAITVNGSASETLNIKQGERIRLRLINAANGRIFRPVFPGLSPTVIAIDGMPVASPFPYSSFSLAPGNRLDLDIIVGDAAGEIVVSDQFTRYTNNLGTLVVGDEVVETPAFPLTKSYVPAWVNAGTLPADQELLLNARRGGTYGIEWTINDQAWGASSPIKLEYGEFQKLRIQNLSGRLHPMHLHGQFFRVLSRNGVPQNELYWQDTVLISSKETVEIGIIPLDKGSWATHCHILEHAEAGMMTTLEVN
ncbi:MAG: multicopper oxidase family protein [Candidatus Peregrinibacteria bacterium]|nr:multicopper oxidase family protein [Candidatus Peregrinibacteria bacterium]